MADVVTLGDVSTGDTGSGSQLKTGGRRQHNMPKKCVERKMKTGMSRDAAVKACYPDSRFSKDRSETRAHKAQSGSQKRTQKKRAYKRTLKAKKGY